MNKAEINVQENIRRIIDREVYVCQSMLVEELLKKEIFSYDDIENLYRPFDGKLLSPNVCISCKVEFSCLDSETGKCEDCFQDNQNAQEICEWWVVSDWLANKLRAYGEPVLDTEYGMWWGRCTTGQALYMDDVINTIYEDVRNNISE